MRFPLIRSNLALGTAGIALIAAGLTIGATTPTPFDPGVETPTPSPTVHIEEDDPGFDCTAMGNHICGEMPAEMRRSAWKAWDAQGGAERLLVNTHSKVTLTGYATTDPYVKDSPVHLKTGQLALADSGIWYVFTATNP